MTSPVYDKLVVYSKCRIFVRGKQNGYFKICIETFTSRAAVLKQISVYWSSGFYMLYK